MRDENYINIFAGKRAGTEPLGKPRRMWEDKVKMDHDAKGCEDVPWIHLAQDRDGIGLLRTW
jgi:hypothetical protein